MVNFFPDYVDYYLPDTGNILKEIDELPVAGGTNLVFHFGEVAAGTSFQFAVGATFGVGRRDGDTFTNQATLYAGATSMASDTAETVTLTLVENFSMSKVCYSSGIIYPGDVINYDIIIKNQGDFGATVKDVVLTDILPQGMTPVSLVATGRDDSPDGYQDTSQDQMTGTWENDVLTFSLSAYAGTCYRISYIVQVDDDVAAGTKMTNTATMTVGGDIRSTASTSLRTYDDRLEVYFSINGQGCVVPEGRMQWICTHRNGSTVALSDYVVSIEIPEEVSLEQIRCFCEPFSISEYWVYIKRADQPDVEIEVCHESGYSPVIDLKGLYAQEEKITHVILRGDASSVKSYRNWIWFDGVVAKMVGDTITTQGTMCANSTLGEVEVAATDTVDVEAKTRLRLEAAIVDPPSAYYPMQEFTLELTLPERGDPTYDPIFVCYFPEGLDYVAGNEYFTFLDGFTDIAYDSRTGEFPCLPEVVVMRNYQNTGRTLVRFDFTGFTVEMYSILKVYLTAMVTLDADSTFAFQGYFGNAGDATVVVGESIVDDLDFDGDDIVDELLAVSNTVSGMILSTSDFSIKKWGKGDLSQSISKTTYATAGGEVTYQLHVTNNQVDGLTNLQLVDIFPYVGDTGVILTGESRGSQYNIFPTTQITAEIINLIGGVVEKDPEILIEYSASHDPVRFDAWGTGTIGVGTWSTQPPISPLSSILITTGEGVVLQPYERLVVTIVAKTPIGAPIGETAYNSFAVMGERVTQEGTVRMLPVEPNKVGATIECGTTAVIGQFVWEDTNQDGIYDDDEFGVNGVTVELYDITGTLVATTQTGNNELGEAGYYCFMDLKEGEYVVKFLPLEGYTLTVQNLSSDLGSRPNPETGETPTILLGTTTYNLLQNAGIVAEEVSCGLCQGVTDIIQSVALEEAGLAHILNAEGEKIQKIVALASTTEEMLNVNASVESLVTAVTELELVLQRKIKTVLGK